MAGVKRTLSVDLGGVVLPTPVMIASGCGGTGRELSGLADLRKVGAVVSRSISLEPRKGAPTPRIAESPAGIVWSTGQQNPGVDEFIDEELPRLARSGTQVVVSITGGTLEEYVRLTGSLQGRTEVAAIEVHLSGPDLELEREVLGAHIDRAAEIAGAVARMSLVPVFAKIPMLATDLAEIARAVVRAGVTGVVVGGSPPALSVQAGRLRPDLGEVTGWLSGPAIKPLMLRSVFEVARAVPEAPVIAVGGVRTGADAIEAMLAGAWAVQVGTATLVEPSAPVLVAQGIVRYLKDKGLSSPADIRARLRVPASYRSVDEHHEEADA
ncbi:MAG TPA: dihydroorotate dehydrogenase [Actinomycetota bacterium]